MNECLYYYKKAFEFMLSSPAAAFRYFYMYESCKKHDTVNKKTNWWERQKYERR